MNNDYQNVKQNKSIKISEKGRILLSKNPITNKRPGNFQLRGKRKLKVKIKRETCYGKILDFGGSSILLKEKYPLKKYI